MHLLSIPAPLTGAQRKAVRCSHVAAEQRGRDQIIYVECENVAQANALRAALHLEAEMRGIVPGPSATRPFLKNSVEVRFVCTSCATEEDVSEFVRELVRALNQA